MRSKFDLIFILECHLNEYWPLDTIPANQTYSRGGYSFHIPHLFLATPLIIDLIFGIESIYAALLCLCSFYNYNEGTHEGLHFYPHENQNRIEEYPPLYLYPFNIMQPCLAIVGQPG